MLADIIRGEFLACSGGQGAAGILDILVAHYIVHFLYTTVEKVRNVVCNFSLKLGEMCNDETASAHPFYIWANVYTVTNKGLISTVPPTPSQLHSLN